MKGTWRPWNATHYNADSHNLYHPIISQVWGLTGLEVIILSSWGMVDLFFSTSKRAMPWFETKDFASQYIAANCLQQKLLAIVIATYGNDDYAGDNFRFIQIAWLWGFYRLPSAFTLKYLLIKPFEIATFIAKDKLDPF